MTTILGILLALVVLGIVAEIWTSAERRNK